MWYSQRMRIRRCHCIQAKNWIAYDLYLLDIVVRDFSASELVLKTYALIKCCSEF